MRFLLISDTHETPGGSETPGTARPGIAELPWPGEAESEACSSPVSQHTEQTGLVLPRLPSSLRRRGNDPTHHLSPRRQPSQGCVRAAGGFDCRDAGRRKDATSKAEVRDPAGYRAWKLRVAQSRSGISRTGRPASFQRRTVSTAIRYIEENPVAAGLVGASEDWLWGSAHEE